MQELVLLLNYFFLQAEDGIRDRNVTGVQTCALPIFIQIPRIAVREALRAGRLIEVLPGYRAEPLSLSLVYPQRRELSQRVNQIGRASCRESGEIWVERRLGNARDECSGGRGSE